MKTGDVLPQLELAGISRTTLALYAGASGDHNPMHIDLDVARSAGMEDVFAHGMLNMAYLGRLLTNYVPQENIRSYSVRFASITPLHGKPTCTAAVTKVEDGVAHLDLTVALADGTVTLRGDAVVAA
ncbi:MaoC/PaaZ C-terminal domain-containing protein [Rhodococcus sp. OK302]|uniref:MaoC/PaaZ C-terminal domain-containing protein n=1 Tax=Rhodococcus sp. OK302 TaxID=1882769 RepID=UPI000B945464|nr:MaoC/PaaZ C-terminal domain-containing protein [Rhodococcus sp. OK302]OYD66658.1 acyl dehydratase [Rhodococcus sp. OK302]